MKLPQGSVGAPETGTAGEYAMTNIPTTAPIRAAIYARVSTRDKGQDPENQLEQLREYCRRQGWTITGEYIDHETAKHGNRDAFKRLFDDASRRAFDVLVGWALDRLTREGVWETFAYVRALAGYGVQFESFTEAHFRTWLAS
jgi:DNA invertase Pin-like site-specific DNA recombinase